MFKQLDLTRGPIHKRLLQFFFPILLGVFFQQLYNTVDALVVGNLVGKEALAAVGGSASQIVNLLVGFFLGLSSGATVLIAQYYGGRQYGDLKSALHTTVVFSILGGAVLMGVGYFVARPALELMKTPQDTMTYSIQYVRVIFLGVIPSLIYNMGSGILRAMGDSRRPLLYLIVCCLTNTVLDLVFVAVLKMEVLGVAIATALSQCVSAVLVLTALHRLDPRYHLAFRDLKMRGADLRGIMRIGLPAALQGSSYSISNLLLLTSVNALGTDTVAGWTATGKADSIFWMLMGALGTTVLTFMGQNVGAGKLERAKKGVRMCLIAGEITAVVLTALLLLFGKTVISFFNQDQNVVDIGYVVLTFCVPAYVMWVIMEVLSGALRGSGDAFWPMVMNLTGICGLRLIWLYTAVPLHHTVGMISMSYPITWVITGIAFLIYYKAGAWQKRLPARPEPGEPEEFPES